MPRKKSAQQIIDAIVEKDMPNMRVVKGRSGTTRKTVARADAKMPETAPRAGLLMPEAGGPAEDDATLVAVEPKNKSTATDGSTRKLVLISKSKGKIIALQG